MPGKLEDGITGTYDANIVNSKAFCEGRQAKVYADNVNPHVSGSEAGNAWAAGYALTAATGVQGPCNIYPGVTVPNLVGQTLTAATALLTVVGLRLGTVTLTTGNVTIQNPAAAAVAKYGSLVNVTLTS